MSNDKIFNIPSVDILMNRGVGTMFCAVRKETDEDGKTVWKRAVDANGNVMTEPGFVKLTNWTLALIDLPSPLGFGGLSAWQNQMKTAPMLTFARTIALMEEKTEIAPDGTERPDARYGAMRLVDDKLAVYSLVFVNALMIAQGIPAEKAKASAEKAYREYQKKLNEGLNDLDKSQNADANDETTQTNLDKSLPSNSSTQDGQSLEGTTTSSGS